MTVYMTIPHPFLQNSRGKDRSAAATPRNNTHHCHLAVCGFRRDRLMRSRALNSYLRAI